MLFRSVLWVSASVNSPQSEKEETQEVVVVQRLERELVPVEMTCWSWSRRKPFPVFITSLLPKYFALLEWFAPEKTSQSSQV
mgnify:CR=1 FL=1